MTALASVSGGSLTRVILTLYFPWEATNSTLGQSQEGSSGTQHPPRRRGLESGVSNPQGFVWNTTGGSEPYRDGEFQTHRGSSGTPSQVHQTGQSQRVSNPQGFVWNSTRPTRSTSPERSFKPTGVRLEPVPGPSTKTPKIPFQTHRGSSGT